MYAFFSSFLHFLKCGNSMGCCKICGNISGCGYSLICIFFTKIHFIYFYHNFGLVWDTKYCRLLSHFKFSDCVCTRYLDYLHSEHKNPFMLTDGDGHQIDLDPMMLTILGIVAGVLIVMIIVTLAIRIHASRSRGRLRARAASEVGNGNPSGNKVVVTTIEELDIDHNR